MSYREFSKAVRMYYGVPVAPDFMRRLWTEKKAGRNNSHPALASIEEPGASVCLICGSGSQIWKNQLTGKLTCHRVGCYKEVHQ